MQNTAEFSYPIGAFGQKKTLQISKETGVTFVPFDKSDRKNGFQRITFTGPNILSINQALDLLDGAVTKFNRHKAWERSMGIESNHETTPQKSSSSVKTPGAPKKTGSRFEGLEVDDIAPIPCGVSPSAMESGKKTKTKTKKQRWEPLEYSFDFCSPATSSPTQQRTTYSAPQKNGHQSQEDNPALSYYKMVSDWQKNSVHDLTPTSAAIPELPEPPLFAQKAWHEHDMSRPMLEPCTGPIPIDEEYQTSFRAWQNEFLAEITPTEDELLDEASEMFEKCLGSLPVHPFTKDEIAGEYEQWELENDLALELIDEAIVERFANVGMNFVPTDHILLPDGELACLETHATDPTALSSLPAY